ncbi:hypothetical protein Dshi_0721 [Dinoroseobacter shibae DFL 12 = DSM 16493]|jgi:hypothetical protein|uniref:Uncharacterized protein n=1 Tax=Dinoroseobacter shibae (strain DSM 16493 / NCIMB 14021 / DFL 12) TaxID=398580 RepID=A8LQS3_DINSH|nr:DUF6497 family protein [Dinoroseobacter shibae]ABV92466.1 hypothetical protein Dshi_0721 [Dinoroseobacter shibae DFL 12 = DSM 16493]URF47410.1 DUF6497 family protein [Dinoroseobacter shibae]URF51721.1 DUF6497 family protein [Dinoroseobacter shibae]
MIGLAPYPGPRPPAHLAGLVEDLPSGLRPIALPALVEEQAGEPVLVLRYVAPEIARARGLYDYDALAEDFLALCARDAEADGPEKVIVVLQDRAVPRGQANPDATQYVESFRRTATGCDWEGF